MNKKGFMYGSPLDSFFVWLFIITIFAVLFFVGINTDKITFERDFSDEYKECKAELEEAITPSCSPCNCGSGFSDWILLVFGWIGWLMYFQQRYNNKKGVEEDEKIDTKTKRRTKISR